MTDSKDMLLQLCALPGPSGFEEPVAEHARKFLEQYMDETWIDVMGNLIGVRWCGKKNAKKLLFDAHIDENGMIITGIEEGFLRFAALGGPDVRMLPAAEVRVLTDPPLYGVICALPPHVTKDEDSGKVQKIEDMFIDIGMKQEEAEKAVPIGTPTVFAHGSSRAGGRCTGDDVLFAKALDDRASLAAIIRALEMLKDEALDTDLYVIASVQEEAGVRGAAPGAFGIAPDWCVVVDVGHAKTPDTKPQEVGETLGGGVIISIGPNMNRRFTDMAIKLAVEKGIKHQIDVEPGGNSGTNARAIQVSREGVATALFGIPLRYMHSPNEVISLEDVESTAKLLCETAKKIREEV